MNWARRDMRAKRGEEASMSDRPTAKYKSRSRADTYKTRLLHFMQVGLFLSDPYREQARQGLVIGPFLSVLGEI
jgi:hypothetical protein